MKIWQCRDCGWMLRSTNPNESLVHACTPTPGLPFAPGASFSAHKVRMDLTSPIADAATAAVFSLSANTKYKAHDWRNGLAWSKRIASLKRHIALFEAGIDLDSHLPECPADCTAHSGLPHVDCIGASAVMLQEFFRTKGELDDRYKLPEEKQLYLQRLIEGALPGNGAVPSQQKVSDVQTYPPGDVRNARDK